MTEHGAEWPAIAVVCGNKAAHNGRAPRLATFTRQPEGQPAIPDGTTTFTAPNLWVADEFADASGFVHRSADFSQVNPPSQAGRGFPSLTLKGSRHGELLRFLRCSQCGASTPGIRPWDFHELMDRIAESGLREVPVQLLSATLRKPRGRA